MGKIIVITVRQRNADTGMVGEIVSHGIDSTTQRNIPLPGEAPAEIGATFCNNHGEWILDPSRAPIPGFA